jgi:hypothetical protein
VPPLKEKGDLAELMVAADLAKRGWGVAVPWGENSDFDLIAYRDDQLQRIQVKYDGSRRDLVVVRCQSLSLTGGRVKHRKRYTAATIDWIATYHQPSDRCYYVPAALLGAGRSQFHLRLIPTRNNQQAGIWMAEDFREFGVPVEPAGLEPATSALQRPRSPN